MINKVAVQFIRESIFGWIGNLMRDLDAQGEPVDVEDVALALEGVLEDLSEQLDVDRFLDEGTDDE